jgi:hypothetical protein
MFIRDEAQEEAVTDAPGPPGRAPRTQPRSIRSHLHAFFSLPPADTPEDAPPTRPGADESDGSTANWVRGLLIVMLVIVSGITEDMIPLSTRQRIFGMVGLAVVFLLVSLWVKLDDSDLAYADRDSNGLLARFRNRLRDFFNIPVI